MKVDPQSFVYIVHLLNVSENLKRRLTFKKFFDEENDQKT